MEEKYIKDILIALIANHIYKAINISGQVISQILMNSPSCLHYVVTVILIIFISWIINNRKK